MTCENCKCKEIKFSCSNPPVVNVNELCVFPEAMSIELNFSSRCDCHFYYTNCLQNQIGNTYPGIVDCYDRQKFVDEWTNGTYILTRNPDENLFSYTYIGEDIQEPLEGQCFNTGITVGLSRQVFISVSAVQTQRGIPRPEDPPILGFDSSGNTAYLTLRVPARETFQSTYPKILLGQAGQDRFVTSYSLIYACNQPITCDGGLTFTHILSNTILGGQVFREVLGLNSEWTIFPNFLSINPI